jgi:hypothetical protein
MEDSKSPPYFKGQSKGQSFKFSVGDSTVSLRCDEALARAWASIEVGSECLPVSKLASGYSPRLPINAVCCRNNEKL